MQCKICGQYNPPEAHFCGDCGASLVSTVELRSAEPAHGPFATPRKWLLITGAVILIMIGVGYGLMFLLDESGKAPPRTPPPPRPPAEIPSTAPVPTPTPTLMPAPRPEGSQIGNLAPDFQLQDLNGDTVSLSDLRGSPVMLNFWATWCPPCRAEMPYMQQIYVEWQDKGLVILTINLRENSSKVRQFMQSNNLYFPVLLDANGNVAQKYNVTGIPTTFFISKDGIIQERKLGAFQSKEDIEDCLSKIRPTTVTTPPIEMTVQAPSTRQLLIDASRDGGVWWFPQSAPFNPEQDHHGKTLVDYLSTLGYKVTELPRPYTITEDLLEQYDVVIRANEYTPYNTDEIDAYRTYVRNGGKLLLLADYVRPGEKDSLSASFGLIFAGTTRGQASIICKFIDHPITQGVSSIPYIVGSGLIKYPPEAQIVGWLSQNAYLDLNDNRAKDKNEPIGPPVLGCMDYGDGRIVFIGDTNALESVPQPVTTNIIDWFEQ